MALKVPSNTPIYRMKVTLKGSKPPIWRRIEVPGDVTLGKLHIILQIVMGWTDSHLHQFLISNQYYGEPDPEFGMEIRSERRIKLSQAVPQEKGKFTYEYDFGDSWDHAILVEKILAPEESVSYPRCIKGKGACPPEDCGGIWGYYELLEALQNPEHPEHSEMKEWVEDTHGDFDPDAFDLDAVNSMLQRIK
jgi:hypothetical protein